MKIVRKDVFTGFRNLLFRKDKLVEHVANERLEKCFDCESRMDYPTRCMECGCFIPAKVRCISDTNDCPAGKWYDPEFTEVVEMGDEQNFLNGMLYKLKDSLPNNIYIYTSVAKSAIDRHFKKIPEDILHRPAAVYQWERVRHFINYLWEHHPKKHRRIVRSELGLLEDLRKLASERSLSQL